MITSAELYDLIFAYVYKRFARPQGDISLRFSEVEREFSPYVGPRMVRTALERMKWDTSSPPGVVELLTIVNARFEGSGNTPSGVGASWLLPPHTIQSGASANGLTAA